MTKGAFEATLNSQNKDSKKSKSISACFYGEMYKYIDCPYLFTEARKSGWNIKPEIKKKVKEVLVKAPEYTKKSLERAKAELEKKASTSTSTLRTLLASIKPSTFVIQHCFKPGNFILVHGKYYISTPESPS